MSPRSCSSSIAAAAACHSHLLPSRPLIILIICSVGLVTLSSTRVQCAEQFESNELVENKPDKQPVNVAFVVSWTFDPESLVGDESRVLRVGSERNVSLAITLRKHQIQTW